MKLALVVDGAEFPQAAIGIERALLAAVRPVNELRSRFGCRERALLKDGTCSCHLPASLCLAEAVAIATFPVPSFRREGKLVGCAIFVALAHGVADFPIISTSLPSPRAVFEIILRVEVFFSVLVRAARGFPRLLEEIVADAILCVVVGEGPASFEAVRSAVIFGRVPNGGVDAVGHAVGRALACQLRRQVLGTDARGNHKKDNQHDRRLHMHHA